MKTVAAVECCCCWYKARVELGCSVTPENFILLSMAVSGIKEAPKPEHCIPSNIWKTSEFGLVKYTCTVKYVCSSKKLSYGSAISYIHAPMHTYVNLIKFKAVCLLKLQAAIASNIKLYSSFSISLQGNWNLFVRWASAMGPSGVYEFNRGYSGNVRPLTSLKIHRQNLSLWFKLNLLASKIQTWHAINNARDVSFCKTLSFHANMFLKTSFSLFSFFKSQDWRSPP